MVPTQDPRQVAGRVVPLCGVGVVVLSFLAACSSGGCGSGADSAPGAVKGLLEAAADRASEEEFCRYVPESSPIGLASQVAGRLTPEIAAAGGVEELSITDQPDRRMGAEHIVSVAGPSGPIRDFSVMELDGRFVVSLSGEPGS